MIFNSNIYEFELRDILRMYVPFFDIPLEICFNYYQDNGKTDGGGFCEVGIGEKVYKYSISAKEISEGLTGDGLKRELKKRLYLALNDYFEYDLPWGSLTGIRPTKIAYKFLAQGGKADNIVKMLRNDYYVSLKKAKLTAGVVQNQTEFLQKLFMAQDGNINSVNNSLSDCVNLYIHIPFCPTRCSYCSFVSLPREKNEELLREYLRLLCRDIAQTKALIKRQNKKILSVYIGGGTPSVLNTQELETLLDAVNNDIKADCFKAGGTEFTFEAGRPDTVTADKLRILKKHEVTRVCVNPQSFNDKTLAAIGRSHTAGSIVHAFDLCRESGFDINMDLIAGLPAETLKDFEYSLNSAIKLKPENITVHTLSLKKGSRLNEGFIEAGENPFNACKSTQKMIDLAHKELNKASYEPYYLYRQKEMAQNMENTGYCLAGKQSVNNITVMEETVPVYACGAGAISKRISQGAITRLAELRDIGLYIKEFDERLAKKIEFLS